MEGTAALVSRPRVEPSLSPRSPGRVHRLRADLVLPLLVLGVAVALAATAYIRFLDGPRHLWYSAIHDRNAHYFLGQSIGTDLRQGDVIRLLRDLDGARVWPPLHGVLVGLMQAVGGADYRLAVIPSLLGWIGAALFGFLAARRAAPVGGNLAGLVAAIFILTSPAFHAYATDVMLESLGAGLGLLVLYLYLVTVQEQSVGAARALGLALTALFLHKYNYWLLVIIALAAAEISGRPAFYGRWLAERWRGVDAQAWLRRQVRQPLNYPLAVALLVLAAVLLASGDSLRLGRWEISLRSPHNLITVAYLCLFIRLFVWWRRGGRSVVARLPAAERAVVFMHAWPVALWFLWPKRLGYFLWFLSPANAGEVPHHDWTTGGPFYWRCLVNDYHVAAWSALLAVGLAAVALLAYRRLRPGGAAILWLVVIAAALTVHHPNRKSRFLHSWIAGGWVAAGVGLTVLVPGRRAKRWDRARTGLTIAAVGGLALAHLPGLLRAGGAPEGGPRFDRASMLDVTDAYLPALDGARQIAILSSAPIKFLTHWTYAERFGRAGHVETDVKGLDGAAPAQGRKILANWLDTTTCAAIVYIDLPPGSYFHEAVPAADYGALPRLLAENSTFRQIEDRALPEYGCRVSVWKRTETGR